MQAVNFLGGKKVETVEVPMPKEQEGWVIVKVKASCICGSDLHAFYSQERLNVIPGHEVAGEIVSVGKGVKRLKPGDRVAIYNMVSCGECKYCRSGNWFFCDDLKIIGGHLNGGDAEYIAVPERNCFLLPSEISFEEGALIGDGVGTPYRAIKKLGINGTHTVLLCGLGPVGLGALLILKYLNSRVIAIERSQYRCKMGKNLGADVIINPDEQDPQEVINEITRGEGVDISIDCAGKEVTENYALDFVKKGGKVAFVGENQVAKIRPSDQWIRKELTVIGSWYFNASEYEELISLLKRELDIRKIVTHRYRLENAQEAFLKFAGGETGKVIFIPELST
jgi:propanol-preferring alcohol dehydrogenase